MAPFTCPGLYNLGCNIHINQAYMHPSSSSILAVSLDADGLYSRLRVSPYATQKEIQRAFHRQSLQLHPDKHGGSDPEMTKKFQEIKAAYEVLSTDILYEFAYHSCGAEVAAALNEVATSVQ